MTTKPTDVLADLDDIASLHDYQDYRDKVASIRAKFSALVEAASRVANVFDVDRGQFRSALSYSDYVALHEALRSAGQ